MCAYLWEIAADVLLGASCRICQAPGLACCRACRVKLLGRPAHQVRRPGLIADTWATQPYRPALAPLILAFKEDGAWQLAGLLGTLLSRAVAAAEPGEQVVLVPVPSRPHAVRARGLDHAATLARQAARRTGLSWVRALARSDGVGQRGLDRSRRTRLRADDFRVLRSVPRALLVDDVVTTGATLIAASDALSRCGTVVHGAAVIADANLARES